MFERFKKLLGQYICVISSGIMLMFLFIPTFIEKVGAPNPTNDLLSAILGIIVALLSIAFPITVGNISERLSAYNNSYIANLFQEESCNKQMKWIIWILILAIILFYFITPNDEPTNIQLILASFVVLLGIVSICIFRKFITRSTQYMIDTDNVVFEYCKQKLKNINNQNKAAQETLLEILRMCGQIILKKEKSQSHIGIKEISSFMTQIVKNIFDDIKISGNEEILILRNITINYYDIVFSIWRNSYKDSPETARIITEDYQEVVRYAVNTQKEIMAFEPLFFFYQRISNEISLDDARKLPFCKEVPWLWYFNIVFDEDFDLGKLQRANMYLLTVIRTVIDNNNDYVFNAFIANTVDGMWGINELNYPHGLDEETSRKLFEIRYKITNTYAYKDFNSLIELINNISDEQTIKNTYTFAAKCFKYNNIQFLVALIGAYCLYRKKNEYIKYIIYYNQPSFTRTIFVNKDIIPHNIQILINWFCNTSRLLMDYYFIWPDHIDLTYWFKKYMAILLCRICMLTDSNLNFDIPHNASKQYLEYLLFSIRELEEIVSDDNLAMNLYEDKEEAISNKSTVLSILASIIQEINERKEQIETKQGLSNEKINRFKADVIQSIYNGSIWYNVLQYCVGNGDCIENKEKPIIYKEIIDKSFLSENDNGIYIGFHNGLSLNIVNRIDFYFEHTFINSKEKTSPVDYYGRMNTDFENYISSFTENDIVVFINHYNIYDSLLRDKDFEWKNQNHLIGKTSKKAMIFSFGDPYDKDKRMIIMDKRDISTLSININDGDFSFIDLNNSDDLVKELITQKPYWLPEQSEDKQVSFLKKQVQISICGNFSFHSKNVIRVRRILYKH